MKSLIMMLVAALVTSATAAGDVWYVDASAESGGTGTQERPFAVIQDAVDAASSGDTIYVAAGVYSNGVTALSGCGSRISVVDKPSLKLIGAGRGKTVVVGSRDPDEQAFGTHAEPVRCVRVSASDGTTFTGFTFRDGETLTTGSSPSNANAGGGLNADSEAVYLVDCDIIHCSAKYGAPAYQGTLVRCLADGGYATGGPGGRAVRYIHSVVTRSKPSGSSTATLNRCRIYNTTVIDNATTWAVQSGDDEIYNSLLLLSGNADVYRETNVICRVENSVLSHVASKGLWQVMGPLTGDWRLLNDSDAVNAGAAAWLTGLSLPADIDVLKDFSGKTIVPDVQGRIHAGALQSVVTPAGGALVFKDPCSVSVDGHAMCRSGGGKIGYVYPETYPTQFCVKANLAADQVLYKVVRYDEGGKAYGQSTHPGFVPNKEGGVMHLLPPPSVATLSTNQVIAATAVLWCDDDAFGNGYVGEDLGSFEHPFGTIQAALDQVAAKVPTVIFVKPGCYANGVTNTSSYGAFRVFLDGNDRYVRIVSTDGPDKTFVMGAPDPSTLGSETFPGCGAAAVKGIGLRGAGYVVQGLTVCGCYGATTGDSAKAGVAFQGKSSVSALVVDCVVSNNVSADSICVDGVFRRCVFRENTSEKQVVSGSFVTSCFLADNTLTIQSSGATGPLTGAGFISHLTLVCPVKSGRLYSNATHYNCIFDGGGVLYSTCLATNSIAYNYSKKYGIQEFVLEDPRFVDRGASPVVKADSPAVGAGFVPTAANYGDDFWKATDGDLFGNPLAFSAAGAPTIGAAQVPADVRTLVFETPAAGGLATSDGRTGAIELSEGASDSVSFVPADGTRPCAGLRLGTTEYWFTNTLDNVITFDFAALKDRASPIAVEPIYTTDWYVDDDGSDDNSGMLPTLALKTLVKAVSLCASGDTLWALPGTYDEDAQRQTSTHTVSNRVIVPAGVTLRSTQGAAETFICGAAAPASVRDAYGCGPGAVRCVYLAGADAKVIGFTLKDGRTNLQGSDIDGSGGGVLGNSQSDGRDPTKGYWVVDCLITNCVAKLGAAISRACLVRSRAVGNVATHSVVYQGSSYGSYIDHNEVASAVFAYSRDIVGSTVGPDNLTAAGAAVNVSGNTIGNGVFLNSLFCQPVTPGGSGTTVIRNSVFAKGSKLDANNHADTNETVIVATDAAGVAIDADGEPVLGSSLAVDAGDAAWYAGDAYPTLDAVTGLNGGQRIFNGRLDAGCNEADWRPRYAADLGKSRQLTVTRADPMVVEVAGGVAITNGVMDVSWSNERGGRADYSLVAEVTGTGTLTLTLNGETYRTLTAADGASTLTFANELPVNALGFSYAAGAEDTGAALLSHFRRSGVGVLLIVR